MRTQDFRNKRAGFEPQLALFPEGSPSATSAHSGEKLDLGVFQKQGKSKSGYTFVAGAKNVKWVARASTSKDADFRYLVFHYDPKLGMATLLNTRSAKQSLLPFRAPPEQFGSRSLHLDDLSRYERKRMLIDTFGSEKIQRNLRARDRTQVKTDMMVGADAARTIISDVGKRAQDIQDKKDAAAERSKSSKRKGGGSNESAATNGKDATKGKRRRTR